MRIMAAERPNGPPMTGADMRDSQLAEDQATFDIWCAVQVRAYEAAGNTAWYSTTKARQMKSRHSTPPRDVFTGPYWALEPWLVQEAIDWFTVANNPRHTFTSWQIEQREQRAAAADYAAEQSDPLRDLVIGRELFDARGALIHQARADGASWADIMAATGLSRMTCSTLAKAAAAAAAVTAAAYADDEPF